MGQVSAAIYRVEDYIINILCCAGLLSAKERVKSMKLKTCMNFLEFDWTVW